MPRAWLEIPAAGGVELREVGPAPLRVGAGSCEVQVPGAGDERLEVRAAPALVVHHGSGARPRVNGREVSRLELAHGDRIEWRGLAMRFVCADHASMLEEIPEGPAAQEPASTQLDLQVATRIQAGLACELGLVERSVVKRWQAAVLAGQFDADGAARELLGAAQVGPGDLRLRERSARLLRDLLMAPLQRGVRGAGRRARVAARSMVAALLAQALVLTVLACLLAVVLLVLRLRWDWSVDAWLDRAIELLP